MTTSPKYSKRVVEVLDKGSDITTNDMNYLFERKVEIKEIAERTGLKKSEILEYKRHYEAFAPKPKKERRPYRTSVAEVEPTLDNYHRLNEEYADVHIAKKFGMSIPTLLAWKIVNGLQTPNVKGLTIKKYKQHKRDKLIDKEIIRKYGMAAYMLVGWKKLNIKELEE